MLTLRELAMACAEQLKKGNGDKIVLLSGDDEGNSYHTLFYTFLDDQNVINDIASWGLFHDDVDPNKVIILG